MHHRDEQVMERLFLILSEGRQTADRNEINRAF